MATDYNVPVATPPVVKPKAKIQPQSKAESFTKDESSFKKYLPWGIVAGMAYLLLKGKR